MSQLRNLQISLMLVKVASEQPFMGTYTRDEGTPHAVGQGRSTKITGYDSNPQQFHLQPNTGWFGNVGGLGWSPGFHEAPGAAPTGADAPSKSLIAGNLPAPKPAAPAAPAAPGALNGGAPTSVPAPSAATTGALAAGGGVAPATAATIPGAPVAGAALNGGAPTGGAPAPAAPATSPMATLPKQEFNLQTGVAPSAPAPQLGMPATPKPAAPALAGNDANALFRKYHGSNFDPNSRLDRAKMQALQAAGPSNSARLQAANRPYRVPMPARV